MACGTVIDGFIIYMTVVSSDKYWLNLLQNGGHIASELWFYVKRTGFIKYGVPWNTAINKETVPTEDCTVMCHGINFCWPPYVFIKMKMS